MRQKKKQGGPQPSSSPNSCLLIAVEVDLVTAMSDLLVRKPTMCVWYMMHASYCAWTPGTVHATCHAWSEHWAQAYLIGVGQ